MTPEAAAQKRAASHARGATLWRMAEKAAQLVLIDPDGLGGLRLRAPPGPVRDAFVAELCEASGRSDLFVDAPAAVDADSLIGGASLQRSLTRGDVVLEQGLLARADGRGLRLRSADRMEPWAAATVAAALDEGCVRVERSGVSAIDAARFFVLALDEGEPGEAPPPALLERLAFHVDLTPVPLSAAQGFETAAQDLVTAQARLLDVDTPDDILGAIAAAAIETGALSIRSSLFCLRAAAASAALAGRSEVSGGDAELACALVLGAAQAQVPDEAPETRAPEPQTSADPRAEENRESGDEETGGDPDALQDLLVEAAAGAALGFDLARTDARAARRRGGVGGRSGRLFTASDHGRPDRREARQPSRARGVDLAATLRAAAPWQRLRGAAPASGPVFRRDDLRAKRFKRRSQSSVIFVVDASGSSAQSRMAEAKGAVERLLSDCYARRDLVALIAFRGASAELALPPTRSLLSVRRALGCLPGGGGTPLASAIASAGALADSEDARGRDPVVVILSDGRGNVALDGAPDRARCAEETAAAAKRLRAAGRPAIVFDTSRRPGQACRDLSDALGAAYHVLPKVDGERISSVVRDRIGRR